MNNARKLVVDALTSLEQFQGYSNLLLDSILRKQTLSASDKAFASRLLYGVIERKITIDYYIGKLSKKNVNKLTPIVLNSLRIAIYQLEFMDRIPDNAAVNESVNIVKNSKEKYAASFVNAILRRFLKEKQPLPTDNSLFSLSIRYSCPTWFIEELSNYIGKEQTVLFLENSLLPATTYLKVNNCATTSKALLDALKMAGINAKSFADNCVSADGVGSLENLHVFKEGFFHVQDISSQLCVAALNPKPNDRVLDICSAPGGKSCTAAELMENRGEVVSCDLHEHRVRLIENNAKRLNLSIVNARVNDATVFNPKLGEFNRILCDVPCSGFGVIRRKPEIKYKSYADLTNLPDLQYNILDISSRYLAAGGTLVYSTCTLRKEENEDVVNRFLSSHPEFEVSSVFDDYFTGCGHILTPMLCGGDGFFFAVLKRK